MKIISLQILNTIQGPFGVEVFAVDISLYLNGVSLPFSSYLLIEHSIVHSMAGLLHGFRLHFLEVEILVLEGKLFFLSIQR